MVSSRRRRLAIADQMFGQGGITDTKSASDRGSERRHGHVRRASPTARRSARVSRAIAALTTSKLSKLQRCTAANRAVVCRRQWSQDRPGSRRARLSLGANGTHVTPADPSLRTACWAARSSCARARTAINRHGRRGWPPPATPGPARGWRWLRQAEPCWHGGSQARASFTGVERDHRRRVGRHNAQLNGLSDRVEIWTAM